MGHIKNDVRAVGTQEHNIATGITAIEPLLTEHQVAEIIGWSVKTLRRKRWAHEPPTPIKISRSVRYSPETIRQLIAAGRQDFDGRSK